MKLELVSSEARFKREYISFLSHRVDRMNAP
jgi:hypothetical protein